jgi:hypothetical protein
VQFRSPSFPVLAAALALAGPACTQAPTDTFTDTETALVGLLVRPSEFLGDTPCSTAPGAMRSYVVTLVDRTYAEVCGDGVCQPSETEGSCARDCKADHSCGNGKCDDDLNGQKDVTKETDETCPVDCDGVLPPPFTLASSLPTPCSAGVRFNKVVAGHAYSAFIDGYEEEAEQIWPQTICGDSVCRPPETKDSCPVDCGKLSRCLHDGNCQGFAIGGDIKETSVNCPLDCGGSRVDYKAMRSGSRHMQYADSSGKPASPRWLATCGMGDQARTTIAFSGTTLLNACDPLVDGGAEAAETAVEIAPEDALGLLKCTGDTGQGEVGVASFDIESRDGLGDLLGIGCKDPPFVQRYTGDALVPESTISFFVSARAQKGSDPVWGSECSAVVKEGLTVRAACAPLSAKGMLRIDIAHVIYVFDPKSNCSGDIASYDASLKESGVVRTAIPCTEDISFGPLPPGPATVDVVVHTKDGYDLFAAACTANVEAGRTTTAVCQLNNP